MFLNVLFKSESFFPDHMDLRICSTGQVVINLIVNQVVYIKGYRGSSVSLRSFTFTFTLFIPTLR